MQPPLGKGRLIEQPLRPERPLVYEKLSDPILVTRAKAGDARALAALARLRQFRGESQFSPWLHRLVVNTCRDVAERQRAGRCEPLVEDARVARDGDPARAAVLSELRSELGAGLAGISAAQRNVVVRERLRDVDVA